jgi:hypothetical protein
MEVLESSQNGDKTVVYADEDYIEELEKWVPDKCDVETLN